MIDYEWSLARFLAGTHGVDKRIQIRIGILGTSLHVINTELAHMMRDGIIPVDESIIDRWKKDVDIVDSGNEPV